MRKAARRLSLPSCVQLNLGHILTPHADQLPVSTRPEQGSKTETAHRLLQQLLTGCLGTQLIFRVQGPESCSRTGVLFWASKDCKLGGMQDQIWSQLQLHTGWRCKPCGCLTHACIQDLISQPEMRSSQGIMAANSVALVLTWFLLTKLLTSCLSAAGTYLRFLGGLLFWACGAYSSDDFRFVVSWMAFLSSLPFQRCIYIFFCRQPRPAVARKGQSVRGPIWRVLDELTINNNRHFCTLS